MEESKKLLLNINYKLLSKQKEVLLTLNEQFDEDSINGRAIEGILNLLDNIQDNAVDVLGFEEELVFPHKNYRVFRKVTTGYFYDIKASCKEEAEDIVKRLDTGVFTKIKGRNYNIDTIEEVEDFNIYLTKEV